MKASLLEEWNHLRPARTVRPGAVHEHDVLDSWGAGFAILIALVVTIL
ncbi:MAG: hypothetical protein ABIX28_26325 [Vicinamibacterales bacterium]